MSHKNNVNTFLGYHYIDFALFGDPRLIEALAIRDLIYTRHQKEAQEEFNKELAKRGLTMKDKTIIEEEKQDPT